METRNKDVTIAGIVTKANVRQTKTGKSFVIFSMEDYSDTIEMALFGEDFLKLGHWIKAGEFLYIKGKMQQRYNTDMWEFKPASVQLLADIRTKLLKNIQVRLDLAMITAETIEQMEVLLGENKGACSVKVLLSDHSENISVEMFSRKYKVEPNNMFIERLKALEGIGYKFIH
jgi:DNA polymerase III subunit alpha